MKTCLIKHRVNADFIMGHVFKCGIEYISIIQNRSYAEIPESSIINNSNMMGK